MESSKGMSRTPVESVRDGRELTSVSGVGRAFDTFLTSLTAIGCFDRFYHRCHKRFLSQ